MGAYPELYLLVEPEKLLAGLPLLADIGMPGSDDWREELESGDGFMLGSGRSWLPVSEFCELLPSRLDWLRSVDPLELRLNKRGEETDGERALAFQLEQGDQYLHVITTNWMQLALPEDARSKCMMLSVTFETVSAKYRNCIPRDHPVMPMLFSFLKALRPIYGAIRDDDVSSPSRNMFDEDSYNNYFAYQFWQRLWRNRISCGFLGAELLQLVEEQSEVFPEQKSSALVTRLPTGGIWFTEPLRYLVWNYKESDITEPNDLPERLFELLQTIPDSAIFPHPTP